MLLLLAIPVLLAVTAAHRYLAVYAHSNILVRHVRNSPARLGTAVMLALLAAGLLLAMRAVDLAIGAGAPGWLSIVVVILAWDAIKIGCLAMVVAARSATGVLRRSLGFSRV